MGYRNLPSVWFYLEYTEHWMGFRHQIHNRCLNSSDDEEEIIIPSHILQMSKIAHSFNPIWGKNGEDKPVYVCRKSSRSSRFKHEAHVD